MSKNKNNGFAVDPRFAEGYQRRNEVLGSLGQEMYSLGFPSPEYRNRNFDVYSENISAPRDKQLYPNTDDDGRMIESEDSGVFSGVGHFLFGDYENAGERLKESSMLDAWRGFHKKRLQAEQTSAENELRTSQQTLNDLKEAQKYVDLIKRYKNNIQQLNRGIKNGVEDQYLQEINKQIADDEAEIKRMQLNFKQDAHKSAVLTELFFDPNKIDWTDLTTDWDVKSNILATNLWINPKLKAKWYDISAAPGQISSFIQNIFNSGANAVGKLLPESIGGDKDGTFTWRAIRNSQDGDRTYDKLFNGYIDAKNGIYDDDSLQKKINDFKEYYERETGERKANLLNISNKYKNGTWYYDPKKINPKFAEMMDSHNGGLLGILDPTALPLNLTELGTSFSDLEDFIALTATDAGIGYATAKLANFAMRRTPYTAALLEIAKYAGDATKAKEIAAATETIVKTQNAVQNMKYISGVGEIAADAAFINGMRRMETNSEVTDAYSSRLIKEVERRGIDLRRPLSEIEDYMVLYGYDPDQYDTLEKLQLAYAYDIPTSNKEFDDLRKEITKGLSKVYNENNALAFKDYIEALPYMPYMGKFLRSITTNKKRYPRDVTGYIGVQEQIGDVTAASVRSANSVVDNVIDKTAGKILKNPASKIMLSHGLKYAGRQLKKMGYVGFMEGEEEGIQHLLQTRYQRGEYDAYDRNESLFDLPSVFNDGAVSLEALAAYIGINFGDPENGSGELKRAMNIGLTTGMLFGSATVFSNLVHTDRDNLRNLAAQLKNDNILRAVVGENYGKAEDDRKVGMFYDAMKKYGVTRERLAESLLALKSFKGQNVTDEFIDQDIELLNATHHMINSNVQKEIAKRMHIEPNTESYKDFVKDGVRRIIDYQHANEDGQKSSEDLERYLHEVVTGDVDIDNITSKSPSIYRELQDRYNKYRESILTDKTVRTLAAQEANVLPEQFNSKEEYDQYITDYLERGVSKTSGEQFISSKRDYFDDMLSVVYSYQMLKSAESVRTMLKNKEEFNATVRKTLGTDIDSSRLISMIDRIDQYIDELKDGFKQTAKQYGIKNINSYIDKIGQLPDDQLKELQRLQTIHLINTAVADVLKPIHDAYMFGEVQNFDTAISRVRPPKWSELTKEQQDEYAAKLREQRAKQGKSTELTPSGIAGLYTQEVQRGEKDSKLRKELKKLKEAYKKRKSEIDALENDDKSIADLEDLAQIRRDAADTIIESSFADQQERKLVAHREFEKEIGVTPHDISEAESGNPQAKEKVEREIRDNAKNTNNDDVAGLGSIETALSESMISPEDEAYDLEEDDEFIPDNDQEEEFVDDDPQEEVRRDQEKREESKKKGTPAPDLQKPENADDVAKGSTAEGSPKNVAKDEPKKPAGDYYVSEQIDMLESSAEVNSEDDLRLGDINFLDSLKNNQLLFKLPKDLGYFGVQVSVEDDEKTITFVRFYIVPGETYNTIKVVQYPSMVPISGYIEDPESPVNRFGNGIVSQIYQIKYKISDHTPEQIHVRYDFSDDWLTLVRPGVDYKDFGAGQEDDSEDNGGEEHAETKGKGEETSLAGSLEDPVEEDDALMEDLSDEASKLLAMEHGDDLPLDDYTYDEDQDENEQELTVRNSDHLRFNFVGRTFFYEPEETNTLDLKIGGKTAVLANGRKIVANKTLGEKLAKNGWFEKANKYYIVTENKDSNRKNKDSLTVAMVIEDPDDKTSAYVTTMRSFVGDKNAWWWLLSYNMSPSEKKQLADSIHKIGRKNATEDQWYALREVAHTSDRPLVSREKIKAQLDELRQIRNEIIDACCVFDKKTGEYIPNGGSEQIKDSVKPKFPRISHGRFNVQKTKPKDGERSIHTFRPIVGENGSFNMPNDTEVLTAAINSNAEHRPIIGYGLGAFGNGKTRYKIRNVIPGKDKAGGFKFYGKGYAGKLYAYVEAPGGGELVPVMLREERFNTQESNDGRVKIIQSENDIVLCIDPKTGVVRTNKYKPSIAEVILQLILGNVDSREIGGNRDIATTIANLIINNGSHTLINDQRKERGIPYYELKQLSLENDGLHIGMMDGPNAGQQIFSRDQIENDENVRRKIVYTISQNFHWNTDLDYMNSNFATQYKDFNWSKFTDMLQTFFKNSKSDEFKIYGLKQLSFKRNDFIDADGDVKNASVLAWMLCNGKLSTDLGDPLFYAPFVYASGVNQTQANAAINEVKGSQITDTGETPSVLERDALDQTLSEQSSKFEDAKVKDLIDRFKSKITRQNAVKQLVEAALNKKAQLQEVHEDFGKLLDRVILNPKLTVTSKNTQYDKDKALKEGLLKSVRQYVTSINKILPKDKQISESLIDKAVADSTIYAQGNSYIVGDIIPILFAYEGHLQVKMYDAKYIQRIPEVTGVFSKLKSHGKLNEKRARKALKQMLGLTDADVIVVDGYLKASDDEDVFGVTSVAIDSVNKTTKGVIALSRKAGSGIHYHEAWHFVNMLLHDKHTREKIYKEYVKQNPSKKNMKFKDLEEDLAEDFRRYMEGYDGFTGLIKKAYESIKKFIGIGENISLINSIYRDIRLGGYKNRQYDMLSIKQFVKKYPKGIAASLWAPLVNKETLDRMTTISSYHEFYAVGEALAQQLLKRYKINTLDGIRKSSGLFTTFVESMREANKIDKNPIIDDVLNNIGAFKWIVTSVFEQYGVVPKWKRLKTDASEKTAESRDVGDETNFAWDIDQLATSKKENITFRAKLFLSQIERSYYEIDESSENGKRLKVKMNSIFQDFPEYVPFSQAWNKVLNTLWDCESFEDRYGNDYHRKSILGMAKRLGKSDPFFQTLYDNLKELEDPYLKAEIFGAIKSSKPTVAYFELRDPVFYDDTELDDSLSDLDDYDDGDMIVADRERQWLLQNDNTYRARRNLPRLWSNNAAASGLIAFENGKTTLSASFAKAISDKLNDIKSMFIQSSDDMQEDAARTVLANVQFKIMDLLNYMSIPFDQETLDYFIESKYLENPSQLSDPKLKLEALKLMLDDDTAGSIQYLVGYIQQFKGAQELPIEGTAETKPLHEIYNRFGLDSQISNMALAYHVVHPLSSEFSIQGPDGQMIYPISQNNTITDVTRWINDNKNDIVKSLMKSPYASNSVLLKYMQKLHKLYKDSGIPADQQIKVTAMVGLKDREKKDGKDYFGITPLEDYIIKLNMTFKNILVLPTMADKKTYYGLNVGSEQENGGIHLVHDAMTYENQRFSDTTLDIFSGYFLDELNSLIQYYSKENIEYLVSHRGKLVKNFHGKAFKKDKQWRMNFDGNGGKFRYMYDIVPVSAIDSSDSSKSTSINANQYLEFLYKQAELIENSDIETYGGIPALIQRDPENDGSKDVDGFELIREFLQNIKNRYFEDGQITDKLRNRINTWLLQMTYDEMHELSINPSMRVMKVDNNGRYSPVAIPSYILQEYNELLQKKGLATMGDYVYSTNIALDQNTALSAIASHVASTAISIIEFEKIYSGDPANYKYFNIKNEDFATTEVIKADPKTGMVFKFDVANIKEKHSDKIKRLGSVLSPGQNLMITERSTYTNLYVSDVTAKSKYMTGLKIAFGKQALINYIRNNGFRNLSWFNDFVQSDEHFKNDAEYAIEHLYNDLTGKLYKKLKKAAGEKVSKIVDKQVKLQTEGYENINVSDAQVLIRPELYRQIRHSLGEWSDEYEEAFQILESDDSWMTDPELAEKVSKLELYPLKMSYFDNGSTEMSDGQFVNQPIYNKMAIFPVFKYLAASESGMQLYQRMNGYIKQEDGSYKYIEGNELDMISFESAVKVGLNQNIPQLHDSGITSLGKLNDAFSTMLSDIAAEDGDENTLPVHIQQMEGLRMQLNTESHSDEERSIGSQMFKIAFSNIIEDAFYGGNKKHGNRRKGGVIRAHIMKCISALTNIGIQNIEDELGNHKSFNRNAIHDLMIKIAKRNGLGVTAEEILRSTGVIASLMQRKIFEQSVSSIVNREIVNINTKGGSAIQQSIFGFTNSVEFDKTRIRRQFGSNYQEYNNGNELRWNLPDGSMEIMLSMNFFRPIVPAKYKTYAEMRNWLIEHNIISGGRKDVSDVEILGIGYRIPTQGQSSMFAFKVADILPSNSGDLIVVPKEFTRQTGSDFDVDKIFIALKSYRNGVYEYATDEEIENGKYNSETLWDRAESEQAVLGVKDPTVDVNTLFETVKDLSTDNLSGAIANRLLEDYIDVLTDYRTYADARTSVDTFTDLIQNKLLKEISPVYSKYAKGGYELLPSFQALRKMEFSTGKNGIGPFALNITNLALTQFTHLSMYYGENPFGFLPLDSILGKDGMSIAGWLSAMVNAHVDVAKDPYIFTLNVNKATYNHVNFLLRAGMGLSALSFIAQPVLKEYAALANNLGGLYGKNLTGEEVIQKRAYDRVLNSIYDEAKKAVSAAKGVLSKEDLVKWAQKVENAYSGKLTNDEWAEVFETKDIDGEKIPVKAIEAAQNYKSKDPIENLEATYFQLLTIKSFDKIKRYADELAELVHVSQIDTKKFGNNITAHIDFRNRYDQFKYGKHDVVWYINEGPGSETPKARKSVREKYGKSYPFRKYFNSLFLDEKFYKATAIIRAILREEMFTATDQFNAIFTTLMCNISDTKVCEYEYYDESGELRSEDRVYYKPIKDEKFIQAMGGAIDNIMRFKSLLRFGPSAFRLATRKHDGKLPYSGPIDFIFGGNVQEIQNNYRRLVYGTPKEELSNYEEGQRKYMSRPLYNNVAAFIKTISTAPYSNNPQVMELAEGLISEDGTIINDFLNYLRPSTASENFGIGRLLLKSSQMGIAQDERAKLMSGFYELLTHNSPRVRQLARDIALYAYYSTYDTNTPNSFFDIVPPEFRVQYDSALKHALRTSNNKLNSAFYSGGLFYDAIYDQGSGLAEEFVDTICRNYWYDDNVVPIYYKRKYDVELDIKQLDIHQVAGIIATGAANSPYIKVKQGREFFIYKKVGDVYRTPFEGEGEKEKRAYGVYKIVSKLGYHQGGQHIYEFIGSSTVPSIFEDNRLSSQFMNKASSFNKWLNSLGQSKKEKDNNISYRFEVTQINKIQNEYYVDNSQGETHNSNDDRSIRFTVASSFKQADKTSVHLSDIVVDFDSSNHKDVKGKPVIFANSYSAPEQVAQSIVDVFSELKKNTVKIYFSGQLDSVRATTNEVENIKENLKQQFIERLRETDPNIVDSVLQKKVDQFIQANSGKFESVATQMKRNKFMVDVLQQILYMGVPIESIISNGEEGLGKAAAKAAQLLKEDFTNGVMQETTLQKSGQPAYIIVNGNDKKFEGLSKNYMEFVRQFNSNQLESDFIMSPEEVQQMEDFNKYIEEQYKGLNDLQKLAEQARQKRKEKQKKEAEQAKNEQQESENNQPSGEGNIEQDLFNSMDELADDDSAVDDIEHICTGE